jgi:cellulose synthase/poly-beta-1,6-N-acetylglucosamine synthase-like glycosyltransferase
MQLDIVLGVLTAAMIAVTIPGSVLLLVLSIAGVLKRSHRSSVKPQQSGLTAVVVPAHDEEALIGRCILSLRAAQQLIDGVDIVVVADNCTDRTAEMSEGAGARVLVRRDEHLRGKGYALRYAFETLLAEGYERLIVVDADSVVEKNFLAEIKREFDSGAEAVQCRYLVCNPNDSNRTRLMNVALMAFNVLRPRGRDRLGLSCGILGNGFGLTGATLRAVPYRASSVVEDLEYHLALVASGRKVRFADGTTVYGDIPASGKGVRTQRARWEGGRVRFLIERGWTLLRNCLSGDLRLLEPLADLMLLPLAFHGALLLSVLLSPSPAVRMWAVAGLTVLAFHVVAAVCIGGGGRREWVTLLRAPAYIAWKLSTLASLVKASRRDAAWVRTERPTA